MTNSNFQLDKDLIFPVLSTLLALIIVALAKTVVTLMSKPKLDIFFCNKKTFSDSMKVHPTAGFNLPIYIITQRRFSKVPLLGLVQSKSWNVLVNIIAEPGLNIYSLNRSPTGKYLAGNYELYDGAPTFLGPESFGAGAKLEYNQKLPISIEVRVFLGSRDKPYYSKKLVLEPY